MRNRRSRSARRRASSDDRQNPSSSWQTRNATQKRTRRAGTTQREQTRRAGMIPTRLTPQWRMGDRVSWVLVASMTAYTLRSGSISAFIA